MLESAKTCYFVSVLFFVPWKSSRRLFICSHSTQKLQVLEVEETMVTEEANNGVGEEPREESERPVDSIAVDKRAASKEAISSMEK